MFSVPKPRVKLQHRDRNQETEPTEKVNFHTSVVCGNIRLILVHILTSSDIAEPVLKWNISIFYNKLMKNLKWSKLSATWWWVKNNTGVMHLTAAEPKREWKTKLNAHNKMREFIIDKVQQLAAYSAGRVSWIHLRVFCLLLLETSLTREKL